MARSVSVFGIVLFPYSLCMIFGAGICIGLYAILSARRHRGCQDENLFSVEMLIIAAALALPAAMLLDSLFKYVESGKFAFGGATFYGGLIFALALFPALLHLKKGRKVSVWSRLCDLAACIPAGHCLGRIGCFLGGCCYGIPTGSAFGVVFPEGSLPFERYGSVSLHPVQLYEAAFLAALAICLLFFGKNHAFSLYLTAYGAGRFLLEFLRGDDRGSLIPGISPAQAISLILIVLGAALFFVRVFGKRRSKFR